MSQRSRAGARRAPCRRGDLAILSALILLAIAPITGSFLGTVVLRLPGGASVVSPPSHCDSCGHRLALVDLVPVVNWLMTRGRCRFCGAPVSAFYPAIEVAALVIALWSLTVASGWMLWVTAIVGWLLLAIGLIDLRGDPVPDSLLLPLVPLGLAAGWLVGAGIAAHLAGAAAGLGMAVAIAVARRRLGLARPEADDHRLAKMAAAAGAWVAWTGLFDAFAVAVVALPLWWAGRRVVLGKAEPVDHGLLAALAVGTWLAWLYGPIILAPI